LAALGFLDGIAFYDVVTGRELAFVKLPGRNGGVCFDRAGNLFSNSHGAAGFRRWPVRADAGHPARLTIGPPERLPFQPGSQSISASDDGRVLAQAMYGGYGMETHAGGWILHPNAAEPRRVDAGRGMSWNSVSPDGRWAAFAVHMGPIRVFEAATGKFVWQSPSGEGNTCCFSPDGRWLVVASDGSRAYRVGTWEPGPQLGPGVPWDVSRDGLVVTARPDGLYRLVELMTGREVAVLEDPEQATGSASFTPDGTLLVVAVPDGLRVWDLRRLRTELLQLGLDWEAPPYPAPSESPPEPLELRIDGA
jgi:WD40 repeat protein